MIFTDVGVYSALREGVKQYFILLHFSAKEYYTTWTAIIYKMYPRPHSILYEMSLNNRFKSEQLHRTGFAERTMQLQLFFIIIIICIVMEVKQNKKKKIRRPSVQIYKVRNVSCSEELSAQTGKDS